MLIALDYDGVIVDSLDRLVRLAQQTQTEIGLGRRPEQEDFRNLANLTFPDLARAIGLSDPEIEKFSSRMFELQGSTVPFRMANSLGAPPSKIGCVRDL